MFLNNRISHCPLSYTFLENLQNELNKQLDHLEKLINVEFDQEKKFDEQLNNINEIESKTKLINDQKEEIKNLNNLLEAQQIKEQDFKDKEFENLKKKIKNLAMEIKQKDLTIENYEEDIEKLNDDLNDSKHKNRQNKKEKYEKLTDFDEEYINLIRKCNKKFDDNDDDNDKVTIKRNIIQKIKQEEIKEKMIKKVGVFISNGSANGRQVFIGNGSGFFYVNSFGNKTYVKPNNIKFYEDF